MLVGKLNICGISHLSKSKKATSLSKVAFNFFGSHP